MLDSVRGLARSGLKFIAVMAIVLWIVFPDPIPYVDDIILAVVAVAIVFTDLDLDELPI